MFDPTKRFTNRVANYLKYRPSYPPAIINLLESECGLTRETIVADIGSGTGFMTELFLKVGNKVFGVEPNDEMRAAGEKLLAQYPLFVSVNATAEGTTLPDNSVDLIVVGQAFHWFDQRAAKLEFKRILKSNGWVVLVWNGFDLETSAVVRGYQHLLVKYGTDYKEVSREIESCDIEEFFSPQKYQKARFRFKQVFDLEGFKGRLLSASYAPQPGQARYEAMIGELRQVFQANQQDGKVDFDYETQVYYGQL
ncbi:MAG TPA: class I SAM-dependent methyltransferase [Pyrinomonadaceae bacterium]|jgi:SAM-dependent methyltransferase|nr:class I SAM-dependent methyltransferase [Pyrinomonadaceae bacterium]